MATATSICFETWLVKWISTLPLIGQSVLSKLLRTTKLSLVLAVLKISHITCYSTEQIISNYLSRVIRRSTFSVFGLMHLIKWGLEAVILSIRIAKEVFHKRKIACITFTLILPQKSKVALSDLLRDLRLLFGFTTDIHRQFMICNNTNPNHQINIWKQYWCLQKDNFTSFSR